MTQTSFDPYATLGLPRGADAAQVRNAYRRLAREHHPDLTSDRRATQRMQRINRAWEILSSPTRRARFDADAAVRPAPGGHWSGTRQRTTQWAPPPSAWSASATAGAGPASGAQRQTPPWTSYEEDGDGPGWLAIVGVLVVLLVVGPILFGVFPVPVFGLLALLLTGWVTRRT